MNEEQRKVIDDLRYQGYAVVIFIPEELRGANPEHVQDRLVEKGWDIIGILATEPAEEFDA